MEHQGVAVVPVASCTRGPQRQRALTLAAPRWSVKRLWAFGRMKKGAGPEKELAPVAAADANCLTYRLRNRWRRKADLILPLHGLRPWLALVHEK